MAIEADQWNGIVVEIVFLMTGFDREKESFSHAK